MKANIVSSNAFPLGRALIFYQGELETHTYNGEVYYPITFCVETTPAHAGYLCRRVLENEYLPVHSYVNNVVIEDCDKGPYSFDEKTKLELLEAYHETDDEYVLLYKYFSKPEEKLRYLISDANTVVNYMFNKCFGKTPEFTLPKDIFKYVKQDITKLSSKNVEEQKESVLFINNVMKIPFGKFKTSTATTAQMLDYANRTHFGMVEAKEALANTFSLYQQANLFPHGILLNGPPAVGKTSLVKTFAQASALPVHVISLGGMKDANGLIGFPKSYKNSTYGAVVKALITYQVMNVVFILDEIDKCGEDVVNALLHITDPDHRDAYVDAYFDFPIDLSHCMFFATANNVENVSPALRRRFITYEVRNHTRAEKATIIADYVYPALLAKFKLNLDPMSFEVGEALALIDDANEVYELIYRMIGNAKTDNHNYLTFPSTTRAQSKARKSVGF